MQLIVLLSFIDGKFFTFTKIGKRATNYICYSLVYAYLYSINCNIQQTELLSNSNLLLHQDCPQQLNSQEPSKKVSLLIYWVLWCHSRLGRGRADTRFIIIVTCMLNTFLCSFLFACLYIVNYLKVLLILLERSSLFLLAFYSIRIYDIHPSNIITQGH